MNSLCREKIFAYLIVNAPKDPQPWFIPTGIGERPNEVQKPHGPFTREDIKLCFSTGEIPLSVSEPVREQIIAYRKSRSEHGKWLNEYEKQALVQWPIAYANETIKAIEAMQLMES